MSRSPAYFDTSFLAPLVFEEATSSRVADFIKRLADDVRLTSQWTRVEFASAAAREVRMGKLDEAAARRAVMRFDRLVRNSFTTLSPASDDFETACEFLKAFESGLRGGDALHLAIATNARVAMVYSLDERMIRAAEVVGVRAERGILEQ